MAHKLRGWKVDFTKKAQKDFQKLDPSIQLKVRDLFIEKILLSTDPFKFGKALSGPKKNLWCYRVGDYRIICNIQERTLTILTLTIGHRSNVYSEKL